MSEVVQNVSSTTPNSESLIHKDVKIINLFKKRKSREIPFIP